MATRATHPRPARPPAPPRRSRLERLSSPEVVIAVMLVATVVGFVLRGSLDAAGLRSWSTVFVSTFVQALPFLALGVTVQELRNSLPD